MAEPTKGQQRSETTSSRSSKDADSKKSSRSSSSGVMLRDSAKDKDSSELYRILARRRALSKSCYQSRRQEDDSLGSLKPFSIDTSYKKKKKRYSGEGPQGLADLLPLDRSPRDEQSSTDTGDSIRPVGTADTSHDASEESSSGRERSKVRARKYSSASAGLSSKDTIKSSKGSKSSRKSGHSSTKSSKSSKASSTASGSKSTAKTSKPSGSSSATSAKGVSRSQSSITRSKRADLVDQGLSEAKTVNRSHSTVTSSRKRSHEERAESRTVSRPSSNRILKRGENDDSRSDSSKNASSKTSSKSMSRTSSRKTDSDGKAIERMTREDSVIKSNGKSGSKRKADDSKDSKNSSKPGDESKSDHSKPSSRSSSRKGDDEKATSKPIKSSSKKSETSEEKSSKASKTDAKPTTSSKTSKPGEPVSESSKAETAKAKSVSSEAAPSKSSVPVAKAAQKLGLSMGASSFLPSLMGSSSKSAPKKKVKSNKTPMISSPSLVSSSTNDTAADIWEKIKTDSDLLSLARRQVEVSPLIKAATEGNIEELEKLLSEGGNVNEKNNSGESLLQLAAAAGHVLAIRLLLDRGADLKQEDRYGLTALHAACMQKRTNVVQFLLHNGADPEGLTSTNDTAMCLAVKHNAEPICTVLLNHGCDVNFIHSLDGQSLLHMACAMRHLRIARILIKRKVNPHLNSNSGDTAFKLLFQPSPPAMNGAERVLESTEEFLDWLLLIATSQNDVSLLRAILRDCKDAIHLDYSVRCGNQSPLANAIKCGSVAVAVKLIEAGAPLRGEQAISDKLGTRILGSREPDIVMAAVHALMSETTSKKKGARQLDLSNLGLDVLSEPLMGLLTGRGELARSCDKDELEQLLHIELLNLSHNKLGSLPSALLYMPSLEKIRLDGNPLTAVPEHVFRGGATWLKVKEYLENLQQRASQWSQFKMLVTGQENVGKTTLLRALKSKKSKTTCKPNLATHGIATHEVTMSAAPVITSNGTPVQQAGSELTFNAWDMGGQSVYYPTHTLFLTLRSLYIVVFNVTTLIHAVSKGGGVEVGATETGEARVSYWLQKIRNLSANVVGRSHPPMFLVGTHVDQLQGSESQTQEELLAELKQKLQQRYPRQRFPGLEGIALVSCKTGEGIQELKDHIIEVVRKRDLLPNANESFVKLCDYCRKYIAVLNEQRVAERERESTDVKAIINTGLGEGRSAPIIAKDAPKFPDMISRVELERWALDCGVTGDNLPAAIDFLRDIGVILYFSLPRCTETGIEHDDLVVLNPQWLADVMSSLISFHHAWVKDGVLPVSAVSNVFGKFSPSIHESLLQLLENFSIVYRIRSPVQTGSAGQYKEGILVPSMLPETCKEETLLERWPAVAPETTKDFKRVYSFPFLPLGFFNRIMVRLLHLPGVVGSLFWQTGMVLHLEVKDGASPEAMLSFDPVSFQFTLHVRVAEDCKHGRWQLLQSLVNCVETVLEELGLRDVAERVIPCTHCIALHRSGSNQPASEARVFMFTYTECADAIMEGKGFVFCNHICSPTRLVRIDDLAPDISLAGVALVQPESLKLGAMLGKGAFGTVYRGSLLPLPGSQAPPRDVAVKEVVATGKDSEVQQIFTDFQQEVFLMSELGSHPNLVNLIGVSLQPRPRMVLELLPGGDLYQLLHPNEPDEDAPDAGDYDISQIPDSEFPWSLRLRIALDIAKGMYGMHSHSPAILHRDLRSPNVFMVCRDPAAPVRAKVADFGLSRLVAPSVTGSLETWQWLAPEVQGVRRSALNDAEAVQTKEEGYDTSSDVYSFAVCCWELVSKSFPFQEYMQDPRFCRLKESTGLLYPDLHKLKAAIAHEGLRPSLPPVLAEEPDSATGEYAACPAQFAGLIESCWHQDREQRPSFREVVLLLSNLLGEDGESNLIELERSSGLPGDGDGARAAADQRTLQAKKKRSRMSRQLNTPLVHAGVAAEAKKEAAKQAFTQITYVEEFSLERQVSLGKKCEVKCAVLVMPVLLQNTDGVERKALELWVGCKDGSIMILDATDLSLIHSWKAHDQAVTCILVVKHHVWVASKGGYLSIWDIQNTKQIYEKRIFNRFKRHVIRSMALVRCPESSKLRVWLASPTSSTIHVYEPYAKGCQLVSLTQLPKKNLHISSVKQHHELIWVAASDHLVLYDPESLECVGCWAAHMGSNINDSIHITDSEVWTSADSGQVSCWKTTEGSVSTLRQLGDFTGTAMNLLEVVGDGTPNKRVWSSSGNRLLIWSLGDKPKVLQELAGGHQAAVVAIVSIDEAIPFFRADQKVWTFGKDASVALWLRNDP